MAINIGNDAVKSIVELRGNRSFDDLISALGVVIQTRVFAAARSPVELRVQQTAHADGMYELWESLHAAYADLHPARVPAPVPRRGARMTGGAGGEGIDAA